MNNCDLKEYFRQELFLGQEYRFHSLLKNILFDTNQRFLYLVRLSTCFKSRRRKLLFVLVNNYLKTRYGFYFGKSAVIGMGVKFPHPNGVIIGDSVSIGRNCTIYQQVTFGGKTMGDAQKGNYPIVHDGVIIFAGAKIIGNISIGKNSVIGANSVVNRDVPENAIVGGIPAKIIRIKSD